MAAQMFNDDTLKQLLLDDVRLEYNWSDSDSEGYNGDTEELVEKLNQISLFTPNISQPAQYENIAHDGIEVNSDQSVNAEAESENPVSKSENSMVDYFSVFFDDKILTAVVNSTNTHISVVRKHFSRKRDCQNVDLEEMKVFIGLIILAGLLKFNLKLDDLWEKGGLGAEVFRLTMSLRRFKCLLKYVNFTHSSKSKTFNQSNDSDEIEMIIGAFIKSCKQNFEASSSVTISRKYLIQKTKSVEQRSKIGTAPGFVVYLIVDSNYCYVSNFEFYDNKKFNDSSTDSSSHRDALEYILKLQNKGTQVILDESCKTSDEICSDSTCSLQKDAENMCGFTIDELFNKYSMIERTKRLLLKLWCFMIDVACLNSFIIYHTQYNHKLSRKEYLKRLGLDLVKNQIKKRATCQYLSRELRDEAANYLSLKCAPKTFDKKKDKPVRCIVCPRKADKKVRTFCSRCEKPICQNHSIFLCSDCFDDS